MMIVLNPFLLFVIYLLSIVGVEAVNFENKQNSKVLNWETNKNLSPHVLREKTQAGKYLWYRIGPYPADGMGTEISVKSFGDLEYPIVVTIDQFIPFYTKAFQVPIQEYYENISIPVELSSQRSNFECFAESFFPNSENGTHYTVSLTSAVPIEFELTISRRDFEVFPGSMYYKHTSGSTPSYFFVDLTSLPDDVELVEIVFESPSTDLSMIRMERDEMSFLEMNVNAIFLSNVTARLTFRNHAVVRLTRRDVEGDIRGRWFFKVLPFTYDHTLSNLKARDKSSEGSTTEQRIVDIMHLSSLKEFTVMVHFHKPAYRTVATILSLLCFSLYLVSTTGTFFLDYHLYNSTFIARVIKNEKSATIKSGDSADSGTEDSADSSTEMYGNFVQNFEFPEGNHVRIYYISLKHTENTKLLYQINDNIINTLRRSSNYRISAKTPLPRIFSYDEVCSIKTDNNSRGIQPSDGREPPREEEKKDDTEKKNREKSKRNFGEDGQRGRNNPSLSNVEVSYSEKLKLVNQAISSRPQDDFPDFDPALHSRFVLVTTKKLTIGFIDELVLLGKNSDAVYYMFILLLFLIIPQFQQSGNMLRNFVYGEHDACVFNFGCSPYAFFFQNAGAALVGISYLAVGSSLMYIISKKALSHSIVMAYRPHLAGLPIEQQFGIYSAHAMAMIGHGIMYLGYSTCPHQDNVQSEQAFLLSVICMLFLIIRGKRQPKSGYAVYLTLMITAILMTFDVFYLFEMIGTLSSTLWFIWLMSSFYIFRPYAFHYWETNSFEKLSTFSFLMSVGTCLLNGALLFWLSLWNLSFKDLCMFLLMLNMSLSYIEYFLMKFMEKEKIRKRILFLAILFGFSMCFATLAFSQGTTGLAVEPAVARDELWNTCVTRWFDYRSLGHWLTVFAIYVAVISMLYIDDPLYDVFRPDIRLNFFDTHARPAMEN